MIVRTEEGDREGRERGGESAVDSHRNEINLQNNKMKHDISYSQNKMLSSSLM